MPATGPLTRRFVGLLLTIALLTQFSFADTLPGKKTMYVGGTITVPQGRVGTSSADDDKVFVFTAPGNNRVEIPYAQIESLEYGQKTGRSYGPAVAVGLISIVGGASLLLVKHRKHYLTIGWKDADGKNQAAIFELGKNIIRPMIATLEARTGKKIQYQDDEARKSGKGN
jgi:hypothetical protein